MKATSLKADLHVHSKYSKRPSEWILRKIGCSESYTEPQKLYAIAKDRGMDLVTITDHDTLAGSLEIAHLEGTFLGEEITTYFPEDRCTLHVLAYGISESQHEDISRLRENVFDLVGYLTKEQIVHALAHPLFSINDRLTITHLEQALVLFKNLELNGCRDSCQNNAIQVIVKNLTREDIERLADKHDLKPVGDEPWKKNLIGGSDDHSSLNIATTYTEIAGVSSVEEFLSGIGRNMAKVSGLVSGPRTLAHNLYSIAYQFYATKFGFDRHISKELLLRFANRALIGSPASSADRLEEEEGLVCRIRSAIHQNPKRFLGSAPKTIQGLLQKEAGEIILGDPYMSALMKKTRRRPEEMEEAWFRFVNQISERIFRQLADSVLEGLSGANLFNVFHTIGSAGSIYTMLAPYFVAYTVFTKDRRFSRHCREVFSKERKPLTKERLKVAHFTDTFNDVNGVALTLQMQSEIALKKKKELTIITCGSETTTSGVKNFSPIGTFDMPEYPDLKLQYPPLLQMLDYCYEQGFNRIHSATPGPVGLAALAIARILGIPLHGTYHTALPQYASHLTGDPSMEKVMWKCLAAYYNQMDAVYVPSVATGDELAEKGIAKEKIRFYLRGVDTERFHPSKRNGFFRNRFDVSEDNVKLLYVGRVSREKSLFNLVDISRRLALIRKGFHLIIAGSGPYMTEMKKDLEGMPVTFTGFLEGDDLADAYASADIFVFPSTTDTFGNVVLEAQASGLPVIVSNEGGPKENLIHGKTGFIVPARDIDALLEAVLKLMDNPGLLQEMKRSARDYTENRSFEATYMQLWDSYRNPGYNHQDWQLFTGSEVQGSPEK